MSTLFHRTLIASGLMALGLNALPITAQDSPRSPHDHGEHHAHSEDLHAAMPAALPRAEDPVFQTKNLIGYRALTVNSKILPLGLQNGARPVALVFVNDGCTLSRRYVPRLNELARQAEDLGADFYAVMSNPLISWPKAKAFQDEYSLDVPLIFDFNGEISRELKPRVVPSAFVVDLEGRVTYQGRIDDRFPALTKARPKARVHDLLEALKTVTRLGTTGGASIEPVQTEAVGCIDNGWPEPAAPNYAEHVAPILNANCVECHTPGGVAPFPLDTYESANRWASMVTWVTRSGLMPPWRAERGEGHFREERFLTDSQIDTLERWLNAETPKGDTENLLPPPVVNSGEWKLGTPDLVLTMPESFEVPADSEDIYRYFVLPLKLPKDQVVVAMDFKPGDASVVHHCNFFVDYSGRGRRLDAKDPQPGFEVFATGGFMSYDGGGALGAWAPGVAPYQLPEGRGFDLPRGGDIVLEIHYHPTGKVTRDQSSIAFYFADGPVERGVSGLFVGTQDVDIPAGDDAYRRKVTMDVPAPMRLVDIGPHMHYLGKEAKVKATLPDGRELPLLHVTDWDLRWQGNYTYRRPVELPAGSKIEAEFRFDNSDRNPDNPNWPAERVRWGWGSDEEMAELYLTVITENHKDDAALQKAAQASWMRSADPTLAAEPDRTAEQWLDHLIGLDYWSPVGESALTALSATEHFQTVLRSARRSARKKTEQRADHHTLVGTILSISAAYAENADDQWRLGTDADRAYGRALRVDPNHPQATLGRAVLYAESQDPDLMAQAAQDLRRFIESPPSRATKPQIVAAHTVLAQWLRTQGRGAEADALLQQQPPP